MAFPVGVHLLLVLARVTLGRWPIRGGAHDPKSLPIVEWFFLPVALSPLLVPIGALIFITALVLAIRDRSLRELIAAALLVLLSIAVWAVAIRDPALALYWFFD